MAADTTFENIGVDPLAKVMDFAAKGSAVFADFGIGDTNMKAGCTIEDAKANSYAAVAEVGGITDISKIAEHKANTMDFALEAVKGTLQTRVEFAEVDSASNIAPGSDDPSRGRG